MEDSDNADPKLDDGLDHPGYDLRRPLPDGTSVLPHSALDFAVLLATTRVRTLHWLAEAIARGGDVEKHERWVVTAFA